MNKTSKTLLKEKEIQHLLKSMILEKSDKYKEIIKSKTILSENEIDALLKLPITYNSIKAIVESYESRKELELITGDLSTMCFDLNKSNNKIPKQTKWEECYDHAKQNVLIETVISHFIYIDNFKRNINCPFHKDKTPSFKVYTKDNRFVCFSCGVKGSPIDFVMQFKDCSFKEAVHYLSNF